MKRVSAVIAVVMLCITGCTSVTKPDPIDVHIDPQCRVSCFSDADLGKDFAQLLRDCEARRALCDAALKRAEDAKAIKP